MRKLLPRQSISQYLFQYNTILIPGSTFLRVYLWSKGVHYFKIGLLEQAKQPCWPSRRKRRSKTSFFRETFGMTLSSCRLTSTYRSFRFPTPWPRQRSRCCWSPASSCRTSTPTTTSRPKETTMPTLVRRCRYFGRRSTFPSGPPSSWWRRLWPKSMFKTLFKLVGT